MANIDYLRECMEQARLTMDDKAKPFNTRRAARSMFHHCLTRIGTMERAGTQEDEPGAFLLGYSEIGR